ETESSRRWSCKVSAVVDDGRLDISKRAIGWIGYGRVRIWLAGGGVGHHACQFQFCVGNGVVRVHDNLGSGGVLRVDSPYVQREAWLGGVRRACRVARRQRNIRLDGEVNRTRIRLGRGSRIVESQPDGMCGVRGENAHGRIIDRRYSVCLSDTGRYRAPIQSDLEGVFV